MHIGAVRIGDITAAVLERVQRRMRIRVTIMRMRVAVLGGGLQGACVALELAAAGIVVDLYDKNDRFLLQASSHNEGKIHLGYVYANDRTLRTARTMVKGGIQFSMLMRRWLGSDLDKIPVSTPFRYVVHAESLLSVAEIETHIRASHQIALEESSGMPLDYFGSDYRSPPSRMSSVELESLFDRRVVTAAFKTPEVAIDSEIFAEQVRGRLSADSKIRCLLGAQVHGVERCAKRLTVSFEISGVGANECYDHVVNTLWEGRLAVDKTMGVEPRRPWLYRVRHYLRLRAPALASTVPSTSIVLGPFGDIVVYRTGDVYLSWYPAGMRGMSSALSPPAWPLVLDDTASLEMRQSILAGLTRIVPAVAGFKPDAVEFFQVKAGIIFAWGNTDIHDLASGLHERHAIGPLSHDGYHTIDTGKLTMAPLFGKMVADQIRQRG
jgi:glycine/D-amino acid oxidase-like deaminating enzyme